MPIWKSHKFGALLVAAVLLAGCSSHAQATPPKAVSYTTQSICHFSASSSGTKYLSIGAPNTLGCGFEIDQNSVQQFVFRGMITGISIFAVVSPTDTNSYGFSKNSNDKWNYSGASSILINPKVINKSLDLTKTNDGMALIGRRTLSGYGPKNGPFLVHGIDVLRLTKAFGVAAELNFAPNTPKQIRDAVESDLIKIVDSVEPVSVSPTTIPVS